MQNRTTAKRKRMLRLLKEKGQSARALSKTLEYQGVRKMLRALERAKLVAREKNEGAETLWKITSDGTQALGG